MAAEEATKGNVELSLAEVEQALAGVDSGARELALAAIHKHVQIREFLKNVPVTVESRTEMVARVRGRTLTAQEMNEEAQLYFDVLYMGADKGNIYFSAPKDYEPTDPQLGRMLFPFDLPVSTEEPK